MKNIFLLIICIYIFAINCVSYAAEFHVSLGGNDSNAGTILAPFASLERAKSAAILSKAKSTQEQVIIWLHNGTYRFSESVSFDRNDSGLPSEPLIISAWPNDQVILSGSVSLPPNLFEPVEDKDISVRIINKEARRKVIKLDIRKLGITNYGTLSRHGFGPYQRFAKVPPSQLYVNGRRLPLARWPNPGDDLSSFLPKSTGSRIGVVAPSKTIDTGSKASDPDFGKRGGTFEINFDRPRYWLHADDIWVDGIFGESWEWSYNRVASFDPALRQITLAYGEITGLLEKAKWTGNFFHFENLLEEIDQPGEWYLDRKAGIIFIYPPIGWSNNGTIVELATLDEPIFRLKDASHIIFRNLIFENGRDVALVANGGTGVSLHGCEIRNFSNGGIRLQGMQHGISASHLHDIGGKAIHLDCGNKETLESGECYVIDSHIHDWSWYHKVFNGAININGVGQKILYNHIHHAPHGAIYLYGNDHLVSHNDIHHIIQDFIDMGGIYGTGDNPLERNYTISNNYFHDIGQFYLGQHAIYPDRFSMGWSIYNNIFLRIGSSQIPSPGNHAIHLNSTSHINVHNNIFIDCTQPLALNDYASLHRYKESRLLWERIFSSERIAKLPHIKRYPELAKFWQENRQTPNTNFFRTNLIWNPNVPLIDFSTPPKSTFIDGGYDRLGTLQRLNNIVAADNPGFINPNAGDFRLKSGSGLLRHFPDFNGFNVKEIGPRTTINH